MTDQTTVKNPRTRHDRPRSWLSQTEMECMLRGASEGENGIRDVAICRLMYDHGMRASELCGLIMSDLDLDSGHIPYVAIRRKKSRKAKVEAKPFPMSGETLRAVRRWLAIRPKGYGAEVFLSKQNTPIERRALFYLVKEWGKRAAIPFPTNPHMLRHSCGFRMANKGYDARLIQDWLGHASLNNTMIYTQLSPERFLDVWGY